jgi:hypothetical protein
VRDADEGRACVADDARSRGAGRRTAARVLGAPHRARKFLYKAVNLAERHGLRYEAACAHFELPKLGGVSSEDAKQRDARAVELFKDMNVPMPAS